MNRRIAFGLMCAAVCAGCHTATPPPVWDGTLASLATLTSARTRCVSPENLTGEPGKSAMATPSDPVVRNVNNASLAASELGRGWKDKKHYLAQKSEIAATTFWYQTEPHARGR